MISVGDIVSVVEVEPCGLDFIEENFPDEPVEEILLWVGCLEAGGVLDAIELAPGETRFDVGPSWRALQRREE